MDQTLPYRSNTFVKRNNCWEVDFVFEPNAQLADLFAHYSHNPRVLMSIEENGDLDCTIVEGDPAGWRIPVGDGFIYTHVDIEHLSPRDGCDLACASHSMLMLMGLYYPSKSDLLKYWSKPADGINAAEDYVKMVGRSEYLGRLIETHCPDTTSALEIGCNVGRNLNYLATERGMTVRGIEYSRHAIQLLRQTYRSLDGCTVYPGDAVEQIHRLEDNSSDIVFSMAVLMHLHPSTPDEFFSELVRVARKNLIMIENSAGTSVHFWARDYKELIERSGLAVEIHRESPPSTLPEFENYTARVFKIL